MSDRNGLRDTGNHDGGGGLGRKVREFRVLGEEQQVGLDRQALANLLV